MPRTRKKKPTDIPEEVLDHFAGPARPMSQADVEAVCRRFTKAMVERMLGGELTHHLGYPPRAAEKRRQPERLMWDRLNDDAHGLITNKISKLCSSPLLRSSV